MLRKSGRRVLAAALCVLLAATANAAVVETVAVLAPALSAPAISVSAAANPFAASLCAPSSFLAAPLTVLSPAAPLSAPAAEPSAAGGGLFSGNTFDGAAARAALERASGDDYAVRVLTRDDGESRRVVVLLGESHVKSQDAAERGRRVIERFRAYAFEGYSNPSPAARRFMDEHNAGVKRLVASAPKKYEAGSTIEEAQRLAVRRAQRLAAVRKLLLSMSDAQRRELLDASSRAAEAGAPGAITIINDDAEVFLDAAGLRDVLRSLDAESYARVEARVVPRRFKLESGHTPGLGENIALRRKEIRSRARAALSYAFAFGALSLAYPPLQWLALAAVLPEIYLRLGDRLPQRVLDGPLGALFPIQTGMVRGRDRTMSRNLAILSASDVGADPVLAIVGAGHAPGMTRRLIRDHGFVESGLDALSPR